MSKSISPFKFKYFSVSHHRSAMKVGVDGVLIGCWTDVKNAHNILDVGTGCGLIALIMAQRSPQSEVVGIDIDHFSVEEASENVANSSWSDRIRIIQGSFPESLNSLDEESFDLIISNPPYFDAGVSDIVTSRERARHQGTLSPFSLLSSSRSLLSSNGMVAMVVPSDLSAELETEAGNMGYTLIRKCLVRGHAGVPYKRALLQWTYNEYSKREASSKDFYIDYLTLETVPNSPTDEYRNLCKDFYLKF